MLYKWNENENRQENLKIYRCSYISMYLLNDATIRLFKNKNSLHSNQKYFDIFRILKLLSKYFFVKLNMTL